MAFILNPKEGVDYLTLDYEGFKSMMIKKLKERLPEYTDYSETDMGVILIELAAHGLDVVSYYKDRLALECFLDTVKDRRNAIRLCRNIGYTMHSNSPALFYQIFSRNNTDNDLTIHRNDYFKVKTRDENSQEVKIFEVIGSMVCTNLDEVKNSDAEPRFEFSHSLVIPAGMTGVEGVNGEESIPRFRAVIVEGETVPLETVGRSTGSAYQKFTTYYTPAMDYTPDPVFNETVVRVFVGEGDEVEEWTRVESFLLSNSTSKHYTYTVNELGQGEVEFGNGISGAIPAANSRIRVTYRVGGGSSGNVGAFAISEFAENTVDIDFTYNPEGPLIEGVDRETIDEARVKAPASLRSLDRAVTERDYADVGLQVTFMQSTESFFLETIADCTRHGFPESDWGRMKVWLLPKNPVRDPDNNEIVYIPESQMEYLRTYYDERRMVGQPVDLYPAVIRPVKVTVRCSYDPNYIMEGVRDAVRNRLIKLMSLGQYNLNQPLIWSDLVRNLTDKETGIPGLTSITFVVPDDDSLRLYVQDDIPSQKGHVFVLDESQLDVRMEDDG